MSTGTVICSICKHELHQDGPRSVVNGWRHCDTKTPKCDGATVMYPESANDIAGQWCGRDGGIPSRFDMREFMDESEHDAARGRRPGRTSNSRDHIPDDMKHMNRKERRAEMKRRLAVAKKAAANMNKAVGDLTITEEEAAALQAAGVELFPIRRSMFDRSQKKV